MPLIVIDGSDGSGKATQTRLLSERLLQDGFKVKVIDFPQYTQNFFGSLIGECLAGQHGDFISVSPHIASVLYAADRFESSKQISQWIKKGYVVIADRYVSANQMHQGGKIHDDKKRKEFLTWLDRMEFEVFGIPCPDIVLFLDVPVAISQQLLKSDTSQKKVYVGGKKMDLAEENIEHMQHSRDAALNIVKKLAHWQRIECVKKGSLLTIEQIHQKVYSAVIALLSKNKI